MYMLNEQKKRRSRDFFLSSVLFSFLLLDFFRERERQRERDRERSKYKIIFRFLSLLFLPIYSISFN